MNNVMIFLISILILLSLFTLFICLKQKANNNIDIGVNSLDQINKFKEIVDYYIDVCFHETLFYYLNKEITFDVNSSVKMQKKFNYRECIRNLIRPDVKLEGTTFKQVFIQRIYFYFVSETPKSIKSLIYAFHSGYDINNYWDKHKERSVSVYVINHIDKMINQYFCEVTKTEQIVFNEIGDSGNTSGMDVKLKAVDSDFYSKLCSFIYNLNVIRGIEISDDKQPKTQIKTEGEQQK